MLFQLFGTVFSLSVLGAVLYVVLKLLKKLLKNKFGSRWHYYSWLAVLLAMIMPVMFGFLGNIMPRSYAPEARQTAAPDAGGTQTEPLPEITAEPTAAPEPTPKPEVKYVDKTPIRYRSITMNNRVFTVSDIVSWAWAAGAAVFLIISLISYFVFLAAVKKRSYPGECPELAEMMKRMGIKRRIRLYKTKMVNAPLMTGVFFPSLLLPDKELDRRETEYILMHELTHYKRRDLWYKWFAILVNSVHWFNPFMYLMVREINRECEISCDIEVTRGFDEERKKEYMNTILSVVSEERETRGMEKKGGKENV